MICGDGTFDAYCGALAAVGLTAKVSADISLAQECDGLLLPGGGDIFDVLGSAEAAVIRTVLHRRRPVLGICRGMQALNVWCGGTLHRCIAGHQQPQGDMVHPTRAVGLAATLLGAQPAVTSNHHQAIKALGTELTICQWSPDGVAEAVVHNTLPALGVQYHPERQSFSLCRRDAVDAAPLFLWWADQVVRRKNNE